MIEINQFCLALVHSRVANLIIVRQLRPRRIALDARGLIGAAATAPSKKPFAASVPTIVASAVPAPRGSPRTVVQTSARKGVELMNLSMSGLPAIIIQVGFIVVFSTPVWLAAKIVGAERPTLIRSALALIVGVIGSIIAIAAGGGWAFLLIPIVFLLAFKLILGTSIFGAIGIAAITVAGYAAMIHFIGSAFTVSGNAVSV
jgi:hypothetical protein